MRIKSLKANRTWDGDILLEISLPKDVYNIIEPLLSLNDTEISKYDLTIEKRKEKRSLDSNSYLWLLIGKLAEKLGKKNTDVYKEYVKETSAFKIVPIREDAIEEWFRIWGGHGIGWICEDMGECRNIKGYHNIKSFYGSSVYDTKQMSHLIDMVVQDCKDAGIETLPPDELQRLKELWK